MTDDAPTRRTETAPVDIDPTVAHAARVYDYLLGGVDNFAADRAAAALAGEAVGGIENARADVRANRRFLGRAVAYLAGDVGLRQFLDIGTGIPNADNTHAVARQVAPDTRVVYVDNDPIVLAHAHDLLASSADGGTAFVDGDLRDVDDILEQASATLDLTRPVGLVLVAILHFFPDDADPQGLVARLVEAVPSGSHVVISHLASDIESEQMADLADRLNRGTRDTFVMRSASEVARFVEGLELVEPGLVPVDQWRPDAAVPDTDWVARFYGVVARKP